VDKFVGKLGESRWKCRQYGYSATLLQHCAFMKIFIYQ